MSLETLLQQLYESPLAAGIRANAVAFPWIESLHVLALTLVFGTIAIVDIRLLGFASHRRSARQLMVELLPFTWGAFGVAVVTGSLLFTSNAVAYVNNTQFLLKMLAMLAAGVNMGVFHLTAYRRIGDWDDALPPPAFARAVGVLSLSLWVLVIILGRWVSPALGSKRTRSSVSG
jgi:hypothetical protein